MQSFSCNCVQRRGLPSSTGCYYRRYKGEPVQEGERRWPICTGCLRGGVQPFRKIHQPGERRTCPTFQGRVHRRQRLLLRQSRKGCRAWSGGRILETMNRDAWRSLVAFRRRTSTNSHFPLFAWRLQFLVDFLRVRVGVSVFWK